MDLGLPIRSAHTYRHPPWYLWAHPPGLLILTSTSTSPPPTRRQHVTLGLHQVCPSALAASLGGGDPCPSGQRCKMYHPYVRPSTEDIVARLYPKRNGERAKVYRSGAVLKGTVVDEVFQVCFQCFGLVR